MADKHTPSPPYKEGIMDQIVIDFETASAVPIEAGLMNYFNAPHAKALCMAYKINNESTKLWKPPQPQPYNPQEFTIYAHHVMFDYLAWNILCPHFTPIPIKNCIDIMALCGRFTFPQGLDPVTKILNKKTTKNPAGKKLIKAICMPPFKYDGIQLIELFKYCVQDVEAAYELLNNLPAKQLTKLEQNIWLMTQEINLRGIPVDVEAAEVILRSVNLYLQEETNRLQDLTDGVIKSPGQTVAIRNWVNKNSDLDIPGVGADIIEKVLDWEYGEPPEVVAEVLKIRKDVGQSSIKKLEHVINASYKGRLYFNLRYYKARTGRFAGEGFQIHNLPRDAVDAETFELLYTQFIDKSIFFHSEKSPIDYGKMMIRGLVSPNKPLFTLVWFDYANIESRMLFWLANDQAALGMYRKGIDLYVHMAAFILLKKSKDITPKERFLGKQAILLCGYGGGALKLQTTANSYNIIEVSYELAKQAVDGYRKKYTKVRNMWYTLADTALSAVENFNHPFTAHGVIFKRVKDKNQLHWLRVTIPSGRNLYYCDPGTRRGPYGKEVYFYGLYKTVWTKLSLSPQVIVENIVQGLSRDILTYHKLIINKKYPIIFSVHDEICSEIEDSKSHECYEYIGSQMINPPFWCTDVPLEVEGKIKKRWEK